MRWDRIPCHGAAVRSLKSAEVQNMPTDLFRRHLGGSRSMAKRVRDDGSAQSMEEIMVSIHAWTEECKAEQAGRSLAEPVRIGLATRAETLALLAELSDEDLRS